MLKYIHCCNLLVYYVGFMVRLPGFDKLLNNEFPIFVRPSLLY